MTLHILSGGFESINLIAFTDPPYTFSIDMYIVNEFNLYSLLIEFIHSYNYIYT